MKKTLLYILIAILPLVSSAQNVRDRIQQRRAEKQNNTQEEAAPPDYSDLFYWAAHPFKKDMSDSIPAFLKDEIRDTLADVFFLHPTTFIKNFQSARMNAYLDDEKLNETTDNRTILYQSSVFNNCCRVFAPRYRQAHLKAYMAPYSSISQNAFDLAYSDLKNAFQYYLDHYNNGRPIVIAAHSQGAMHAVRLLKEFFDGKPLQKQLVCAYIVGWQIKPDDFKTIPVGDKPDATGCFVGWRSYKKGETDFIINMERGGSVCVNPISWTTSSEETKPEEHKGAVAKDFNRLVPNVVSAMIEPQHKILWVDAPEKLQEKILEDKIAENKLIDKLKNYHVADYNLFWMDIRENARLRVEAFLEKKK